MWLPLVLLVGSLPWMAASHAGEFQRFVLNPGWNLITFQVLPANRQGGHVFSSMEATDGSGARLFDPDNPEGSRLKAAFALDGIESGGVDQRAHVTWRALEGALYTDPETLPSGSPFPELDKRQLHMRADAPLDQATFSDAYLLLVGGIAPATAFRIEGEILAIGVSADLKAGWNLVGFPFDTTVSDQAKLNIASFFPQQELAKIERVATWDSAGGKYQSYFPDRPEESRLQFLNASNGYWVFAKEAISLDPRLVVGVPADADLPPLQKSPIARHGVAWNPGPEDLESSPPDVPPVFDSAETQTWIRIAQHEVKLRLPLYNAGGGVVGWTAKVAPFSGDVLRGAVALERREAVENVFSLSARRGLVSADTQVLEIAVDRTHLQPATYLADLTIKPSVGGERRFHLVLESGGLEGQWAGYVTVETVNGRRNAVPDIDVHLHISADTLDGSRLLRGFIDSQETLLWPLDAPVLGQILEPRRSPGWRRSYRARFVLEGGLTLAPGDLNRFPFDRFPIGPQADNVTEEVDSHTGLPYRTNREGDRHYFTLPGRAQRANFSNPTPSFIARHFQILGEATPPDGDIPVIRGRYVETVTGLLNGQVRLEGRFRLQRVSSTPYERRPAKLFFSTPMGGLQRVAAESVEAEIEVKDDVLIDRVLVIVAQTAADRNHRLVLTAPDGTEITLHDGEEVGPAGNVIFDSGPLPVDALGLLDPPDIRGAAPLPATHDMSKFDSMRYETRLQDILAAYVVRRPRESLNVLRNGRGSGTWTLSWTHDDEERTQAFKGWSLLLFGPRIARVAGQVAIMGDESTSMAMRYADVDLQVVGLPASLGKQLIRFDRTSGEFEIGFLPEMRLDVLASKPGFAQAGISGLNGPDHPRGFRDHLEGLLAGGPGSTELTIKLKPAEGLPVVKSSVTHAVVSSSAGRTVDLDGVRLSMFGGGATLVPGEWEVSWEGGSALTPGSAPPKGRSVTVDIQLPLEAFTPENNWSVSVWPRVQVSTRGIQTYTQMQIPLTVTLANPPRSSPYRLLQAGPLSGFGGGIAYVGGVDTTGRLGLEAQKTTMTKVDMDRTPTSETGHLGEEDVDLHPRTFESPQRDDSGYAYALIIETTDGRFARLEPPLQGQAPRYRDERIGGRDINAPGEPVAIHSAIGGQVVNMGVSGSNGNYRISAGVTPGADT